MIRGRVTSLEEVPEALRPHYVRAANGGGYVLEIEGGLRTADDIDRLKTAFAKRVTERENRLATLRDALERHGVTAEEIRTERGSVEADDAVRKELDQLESRTLGAGRPGSNDEMEPTTATEQKVDEARASLSLASERLARLVLEDELAPYFREAPQQALADALEMATRRFDVASDGTIKPKDGQLTIERFAHDLGDLMAPQPRSVGSGASGSRSTPRSDALASARNRDGTLNVTKASQLAASDPGVLADVQAALRLTGNR